MFEVVPNAVPISTDILSGLTPIPGGPAAWTCYEDAEQQPIAYVEADGTVWRAVDVLYASRAARPMFQATHQITHRDEDHLVMLMPDSENAGPAYTRAEWDTDSTADFEFDGQRWTFQGQRIADAYPIL